MNNTKIKGIGETAGWKRHKILSEAESTLKQLGDNNLSSAVVGRIESKVITHITVLEESVDGLSNSKEMVFVLNPVYHGQGIVTEVVLALLE
ncbi:hypothetical protein LI951_11395 [Enterococcus sp. BWT-B8]|uniref:hypothetical protein n=1 Tax=Enterococcus sp. BWT-B8 TaxID=2885157 RepID=UPI001E5EDA61|nr:hypothetical protein [Enterococcus sp. BWT-B8]MCB5952673.1 hypothetical protein [Enterococcus sp. BWT-B8]